MIKIPTEIKTDEDKVKFLYRNIELLRLEHNAKGKDFREGKMTEADFRNYQKGDYRIRQTKLFELLSPIKEKVGLYTLNPNEHPDDPRLKLKEDGKIATKFDKKIDITKI